MVVSVSRRTDIPALYPVWFMNRVKAGFCLVGNPFSPGKSRRVDLRPEAVETIVFWSKSPAAILPHLPTLDRAGYRYYFLYTLNDYPRILEPGVPPRGERLQTFFRLSERIGPGRVIWRYDPIILGNPTNISYHQRRLERLCREMEGKTRRLIVSLLDPYRKTLRRLRPLSRQGYLFRFDYEEMEELPKFFSWLAGLAGSRGMEVYSCAEEFDLSSFGIPPGKCVDDDLIREELGVTVSPRRDPSQRRRCRCVTSVDIGRYNTCTLGCPYCYAVGSPEKALDYRHRHDPEAESL